MAVTLAQMNTVEDDLQSKLQALQKCAEEIRHGREAEEAAEDMLRVG